jgi:hypothetical protein
MLRRWLVLAVALTVGAAVAGQPVQPAAHKPALVPATVPVMEWRTGLTEINEGWAEHDGDDMAWARNDFDDSAWKTVDIENMGSAEKGWHWFRLHVNVGPDHPAPLLMLDAGDGVYELYVNGEHVPDSEIRSQFLVTRPKERVFRLSSEQGDFHIALRTFATSGYTVYQFPLVIGVSLGGPAATFYERESLESDRLYAVVPSVAINLLLVLAGLSAMALYASQHMQREYLYLALFLLLLGVCNGLWHLQQAGVVSVSANFLFADPLSYAVAIAQIEFTLSFVQRRVGRGWRIYELLISLPMLLIVPGWFGHFSVSKYSLIQAIVIAPQAFLLPALLFLWYRRGNREAGWLILPSLLPAAIGVLYNLGLASIFMEWKRFDFLIEPVPLGPIPLQTSDVGNLLFLVAIGFVMFFRFTRVSQQQARSAAELGAAREIQQRLVPASLPAVLGYRIETAYLPAQEVGGDFYQVLAQSDGSTLVVVGDVSGKGLKAAMTGTLAIGALRALSAAGVGPAELLVRLNREMLRAEDGGFITCLCAKIFDDGRMMIANAGHLSPYRNAEEIAVDSGLPLGIAAGAEYGETAIQLQPGQRLTLLSDGVLEARDAAGELFGFERMRAISDQSAEIIAQRAQHFGQEDDITVLTLQFQGVEMVCA